MTLTELNAWIDANVFTTNNRMNTGASFRQVLKKVTDETFGKVETMIGATALKTPGTNWATGKGLEIWGSGGTALGLANNYLEGSIKTKIGGSAEMEFWNTQLETGFTFRDGAARTERFLLKAGNAWLPNNLHVGMGADRSQRYFPLFVEGQSFMNGDVFINKKLINSYSGLQLLTGAVSRWFVRADETAADNLVFNRYSDAGVYLGEAMRLNRLNGNVSILPDGVGNTIIGTTFDNTLAKLQTPSISLGVNTWNYSSDGEQRLYYQINGSTYYRTPAGNSNYFRFGIVDSYLMNAGSLIQYCDDISDFTQAKVVALGASSRSWNHRKEASGVDYRFFDWDGSSARDWWNVYAGTLKMSVAQIIHFNYGSNVGIGTSTPDSSAILDLKSSTKGLLLPQMTTTERNAIPVSAARKGLLIMNTSTNKLNFYNGSAWEAVTSL